ncbi:MAG: ORF6N domain-containing protein, partial [Acidaminococcaceae bacterium]|nr:ORF6N domain-containing protein [Acidaminococcaceae bacterium]
MEKSKEIISLDANEIKNRIFTIRGKQVMLDSDLAELYGYEVKKLNQQVKR